MHNVVPGAQAYVAALQAKLLRHGGTVRTHAAVQELLRENGSVVGVALDQAALGVGVGIALGAGIASVFIERGK